ncbi:hypothetical protein HUS23_07520 [Ectothiorhodospiraceae bacterium 2226]|nr:hypothetical protein HUS23_07520 [Ectothiorhodospiraceae bacterium 2226]
MRIDRCVCKGRTFAELLALGATMDFDPDLVALATGASLDCGTCRPWLERALRERRPCFEPAVGSHPQGAALLAHFGAGRCG